MSNREYNWEIRNPFWQLYSKFLISCLCLCSVAWWWWWFSCQVVSDSQDPMDCIVCQVPLSMGFSRQEYWSGLPFPSPGILLTQESNLGLLHCRHMICQLSHEGSQARSTLQPLGLLPARFLCPLIFPARIVQWVVISSSSSYIIIIKKEKLNTEPTT